MPGRLPVESQALPDCRLRPEAPGGRSALPRERVADVLAIGGQCR
jgi:hypothetical protein